MTSVESWRRLRWWLIYLGPRRQITVDTQNGRLTLDSKDWLIGKHLYVRRNYEMAETRTAVELLRSEGYLDRAGEETVLNVGANIGMTCIGLLKARHFKRAIAFEPTPGSYRLLVHNVAQNGLGDQIRTFPFALSSIQGEVDLELSKDNSGDNRIRQTNAPGVFREERRRTVKVPVKTLDLLVAEDDYLRSASVDMLWIDIQGHEGQLFQGSRRFLKRGIPAVSEFWPYGIARSGMSPAEYCAVVSELFTHFYVLPGEHPVRSPVSKLQDLFGLYSSPRAGCTLVLFNERPKLA